MSVYGQTPDSANTLGGEALPSQMLWDDERSFVPYVQIQRIAINGERDTLIQQLVAGRQITLVASRPLCLFTGTKLTAIEALLSPPGQTLTLFWNAVNYSVIFDQSRNPAINFTEVTEINGAPVLETDRYEGTINLITV